MGRKRWCQKVDLTIFLLITSQPVAAAGAEEAFGQFREGAIGRGRL